MVAEVVKEELGTLLHGKSMAEYNEAFLEQHGTQSLRHRAAAARMMVLLSPDAKAAAAKMVVKRGGLLGEDSRSQQSPKTSLPGVPQVRCNGARFCISAYVCCSIFGRGVNAQQWQRTL